MCLRAVLKSFVRPAGKLPEFLSDLKKRSLRDRNAPYLFSGRFL